jgi:ribosome maturation factor RimP
LVTGFLKKASVSGAFFFVAKLTNGSVYSEKFSNLLKGLIEDLGYECVGCEFVPQQGNALLRVYIDVPDGLVAIEDCEKVSREVSALLDVEDAIPGRYRLEVSSPGFDRPLFTLEHYRRQIGANVSIQCAAPVAGRRKFKGQLVAIGEPDTLQLDVDGKPYAVPFVDIQKGRVVPQYEGIGAAKAKGKS